MWWIRQLRSYAGIDSVTIAMGWEFHPSRPTPDMDPHDGNFPTEWTDSSRLCPQEATGRAATANPEVPAKT
jgi:hypothetical protein